MICYRPGCGGTDLPLVPATPQDYEYGIWMRKCSDCEMYQNHVGDDEPGDELLPAKGEAHIPARYILDPGFRKEAEHSIKIGESELFLVKEVDR
tara:strand:- start:152 stop:433 length:282 start_codon:yes stop_codon:yes gene_type:complete